MAIGKNLKGLKVVYVNEDFLPQSLNPFCYCDGPIASGQYTLGELFVEHLKHNTSLEVVSVVVFNVVFEVIQYLSLSKQLLNTLLSLSL